MATTTLTDVIVPEVFARYMFKDTAENTKLFRSGVLRSDPSLAEKISGGGLTFQVPHWNDLEMTTPTIGSDDPSSSITPNELTATKSIAIRAVRTRAWQTANMVAELAGSDPMARIRSRVSAYWDFAFQLHLVNALKGVFADNTANDSGDMQNVIGTDSASAVTDAELISAEAILDTKQTMGDAADGLSLLIMHSVCFTRLQKQNLIDYIPDSQGVVQFPTYLGYKVIVSDQVLKVAGSNRTKYSTYLLGEGACAWAESPVAKPVEVYSEPLKGDGMGIETLVTRRQYLIHPYGCSFTSSSVAGDTPTDAEFATAANWNRVAAERKQIRMAQLVTNG